jgi:hypothetical protein
VLPRQVTGGVGVNNQSKVLVEGQWRHKQIELSWQSIEAAQAFDFLNPMGGVKTLVVDAQRDNRSPFCGRGEKPSDLGGGERRISS